MPASILQRFNRRSPPSHAVPEGLRVYAIGDVHGCRRELDALLAAIRQDLAGRKVRSRIVFLGDLVDRGPDSAGVISRLLRSGPLADRVDVLMGNHEEVMLRCYDGDVDVYDSWLRFGGLETLESYGLTRSDVLKPGLDLSAMMQKAIPKRHIQFLKGLPDSIEVGDYAFVHAGIRPGLGLAEQTPRDLRWIRGDFLESRKNHGRMIVHGHTIVPEIEFKPNRIAIDTGCYLTGQLSALALQGTETRVIRARN